MNAPYPVRGLGVKENEFEGQHEHELEDPVSDGEVGDDGRWCGTRGGDMIMNNV
jgi:hypothetical protein